MPVFAKSCPFCKSTKTWSSHEGAGYIAIKCDDCNAQGPRRGTEDMAWAAWTLRGDCQPDDGGPAFPQYARDGETAMATGGLSIRDYFAAQVLAGMAARPTLSVAPLEQLAARAYAEADAILRARSNRNE